MKRQAGAFVYILILLSACGMPFATKPAADTERSSTPIPNTPSQRPTSTIAPSNQEAKDHGMFRFCQVWPESAWLGETVNVSAFGMLPNDPVSVYIHDHESTTTVLTTDSNGYVNGDIVVPMDIAPGTYIVVVDGTGVTTQCLLWLWTDEYIATYEAGLTKTPTPTPSHAQIELTATQQVLHDRFNKYCKYNPAWGFRFSPNNQWVGVFCNWDTVEFVKTDETKIWEASADTLINPGGDYFIGIDHWSNDGAYVYIDFDPHTDGYWEPYHQGIVLYRLDLETGQISEVLPLVRSNWRFYSYALSPDDSTLAYIVADQSPVVLNIRDLQTGRETTFEFDPKYNTGGGFSWSPDGQELVFSVTQYEQKNDEYLATSILLFDKDSLQVTELLKDYPGKLQVTAWSEDAKILLEAITLVQDRIQTHTYELDPTTGTLIELNP